jgi:septal ring factor EnvC (AmiA/AmiB activator)
MNLKKLWFLLPVVLLLFVACNAQNKTAAGREEFQRQFESQIANLDQQIQDVKDRASDLSGDDRAKVDESIAKLEEQRSTLTSKLEAMKAAGDDQWEAYKTDLQEASKDLDQAYGNLQEAFKQAASRTN